MWTRPKRASVTVSRNNALSSHNHLLDLMLQTVRAVVETGSRETAAPGCTARRTIPAGQRVGATTIRENDPTDFLAYDSSVIRSASSH